MTLDNIKVTKYRVSEVQNETSIPLYENQGTLSRQTLFQEGIRQRKGKRYERDNTHRVTDAKGVNDLRGYRLSSSISFNCLEEHRGKMKSLLRRIQYLVISHASRSRKRGQEHYILVDPRADLSMEPRKVLRAPARACPRSQ